MQILDLADKLARFPIAYGYQPVRGWSVKHFDTPTGTSFQRTKQNALGEGPWDACERLYVDGFPIDPADFVFHPGDANDGPDVNFPSDASHPWTAYLSAKCRPGISEDQTEKLFGIYKTLRTGNYNGSGQQLNSVGTIVSPSDPRTDFFFKNNPANVAVDQIMRWGLRLNSIINWPAWVNWRDYNDELIPIDDSTYTPRALSLTPTSGGTLSPGTYYTRVSTMKSGDESSASLKTLETKANKIVLTSGQTAFQVNWLIKGDEEIPPSNPSGITSYRVYVGTVENVWLGYFTVSNPASRTFLVTTMTGTTAGNPIEIASSGLLTNVKRFECGLFFVPPYDLGQALDVICQISCADWQWSGLGTNTFRNDKIRFMSPADRAPVFTLNLAETGMGSLKTYPVDRRNRPNQIVVNFRDQDDEFLGPAQPVILDREQLQEDDGLTKTHTIEGGTMRRNQAQRVASFYARVLCDMDQMATLIASPKTYFLLPGDVINVTNPMPGWTDQKFIVRKKTEKVESGLGDDILSQVYTNGLYSDTEYQPLPLPLPTPRLDPFAIPPKVTTVFLIQEVTTAVGGIPFVSIIGLVQFALFGAPQIGRVYQAKPVDKDTPGVVYEQTQEIVVPDPTTMQGIFKLSGVSEGPYRIKVVTESSLGDTLGVEDADVYELDVEFPIPDAMTDLTAFRDISGNWFISGVGHPKAGEEPATFMSRVRRVSDGVLMRDLPLMRGARMAAIFDHIIHADPVGTWHPSTHATIQNNNVIGELDDTAAYAKQPFTVGSEINARVTVTRAPAPFLTGLVRLSFGPSDFTDPFGIITGAIFETKDDNSTTLTTISVFDWSTNQFVSFDLPTVDGVVFVRIVWFGTELRWQFSGSPINPVTAPNVILKDIAPTNSTFLRVSLRNGGPVGASSSKVENVTIGGSSIPQTIYSLPQQENDNSGNGLTTISVEAWEISSLGVKGNSVFGVFP